MKIDRLIGILTILAQRERVTAPYLAEKFEVSRRTINRDIEDLCKAGIPVTTFQGTGGGIGLAEGYKLDRTLFTERELRSVLAGLSSLDSVAQDKTYRRIIEKFFPDGTGPAAHVGIDLSSHYKHSLAPKIAALQEAVEGDRVAAFTYYNPSGIRQVELEPYLVVFRWSDWYVFGYDLERAGFRLFKLNRLWDLRVTEARRGARPVPEDALAFDGYFTDEIRAVILFQEGARYRLVEEYGPDSFTPLPDGRLRFAFPFTDRAYLLQWVLGFGDQAELLEPVELRRELRDRLQKTLDRYGES